MIRLLYLLLGLGLFACSPADRPADTMAEAGAEVQTSSEEASGPDLYQQYMWCKQGDNYSEEAAQAQTARWMELSAEAGLDNWGAFSMVSRVGDPNFDSILGLIWPSKDAQVTAMALYTQAEINAKLAQEFPDVVFCGGDEGQWTFSFDAWNSDRTSTRQNSEPGAGGNGAYRFCSYNEGKEPSDLIAVIEGPHAEWVDEFEKAKGPSSYHYKYLRPDFDTATAERNDPVPAEYDFVWLDANATEEDRVAGLEAFEATGQDVQAAVDEVVTCNAPQLFDFTLMRALPSVSS